MSRVAIKVELFNYARNARWRDFGLAQPHDSSVERVVGYNHRAGKLRTVPLNGYLDFSQANSAGSRGVFKTYFLDDGLYDVRSRISWGRVRQSYLLVADGQQRELSFDEVIAWLDELWTRNHPKAPTTSEDWELPY